MGHSRGCMARTAGGFLWREVLHGDSHRATHAHCTAMAPRSAKSARWQSNECNGDVHWGVACAAEGQSCDQMVVHAPSVTGEQGAGSACAWLQRAGDPLIHLVECAKQRACAQRPSRSRPSVAQPKGCHQALLELLDLSRRSSSSKRQL